MAKRDLKANEISFIYTIEMNSHSLNNEGIIGNTLEPRKIYLADGKIVDGIRGGILKRSHSSYMWMQEENKLDNLCNGCRIQDPRRIASEKKVSKEYSDIIASCVLCDCHGFLIAQKNSLTKEQEIIKKYLKILESLEEEDLKNEERKKLEKDLINEQKKLEKYNIDVNNLPKITEINNSKRTGIIKFSNAIGIESISQYVSEVRTNHNSKDNNSTAVVYKNDRSGIYVGTSHFEAYRIGYNEVDFKYEIDDQERKRRFDMVLDAYRRFFTLIYGANLSRQMPHVANVSGLICLTKKPGNLGLTSPLTSNYKEINKLTTDGTVIEFNNLIELNKKIKYLKSDYTPYKILGA